MDVAVVRVFYRYAHTQNMKARPGYFSKGLALASFVRALGEAAGQVRVTFVVDGQAPAPILDLMGDVGEVVRGSYGSNRASYRATITRVASGATREELTWFAEDDYLYQADSLVALVQAASEISEASWFALSGPTPAIMLEMRRAQGPVHIPPLDRPEGIAAVDGRRWRRIDSTTSTFGGRTTCFVRDARLLRAIPYTGAAWDRTTCLTVQGITPYPWRHVTSDLLVPSTPEDKKYLRVAYRLATRVAVNLRSIRIPANRGILVAPEVPLVGHMNLPYEHDQEHWDEVAADTSQWIKGQGLEQIVSTSAPQANTPDSGAP